MTIAPYGSWTGTYFSEELKAAVDLGYIITRVNKAKEFTQGDIFTKYVEEMYRLKRDATGAQRFIAKLLLNSLYGKFGMKQEQLSHTKNLLLCFFLRT